MLELLLKDGTRISLRNKSLLMINDSNQTTEIVNKEDDYDIIYLRAGVGRKIHIELQQPAIIILEGGVNNCVHVTGGMALPLSQAVFIAGISNKVEGLTIQNDGKILLNHHDEFDLGFIGDFNKITIWR